MSWQDIPGWFDFDDIYDEAISTAPKGAVIVEVGVAFGRSLAYLARKALDAGRRDLIIYGVDPWQDDWNPDWNNDETKRPTWGAEHAVWARQQGGPMNAFVEMMRTHAREELELVRPIRGYWQDAAKMIEQAHGWNLSMVFIDGDHRYEPVLGDIKAAQRLVIPRGIIAGHDYTHEFPGVQQAVHEVFGELPARRSSFFTRV